MDVSPALAPTSIIISSLVGIKPGMS